VSTEPDKIEHEPETLAADLIIPVLGCGLSAYYIISTAQLAWEARATGTTIAGLLLALCALLFARTGLKLMRGGMGQFTFGDLFESSIYNRQRMALVALLIVFILTIQWLGTTLGLLLLMLASLWVMGVTSSKQLIGISVTSAAVVYLLFIFLLNSRMPRGIIENSLATILPPLGS
jgi:hypothetical protein